MGLFDIFRRKQKKTEEPKPNGDFKETTEEAHEEKQLENVSTPSAEKTVSEKNGQSETDETVKTAETESQAEVENSGQGEQPSNESAEVAEPVEASSTDEEPTDNSDKNAPTSEEGNQPGKENLTVVEKQGDASEENTDKETELETTSDNSNDGANTDSTEENTEQKYDQGLEKSRHGFGARLNKFLANFRHVDEDFFDDLEDMLIESDVGYDMAMKLSDSLRKEVKLQNAKSKQDVSNVIIQKMVELYEEAGNNENSGINFAKSGPTVIMFVGVNGAGKTTTIGKMAALFKKQGKKVLLAAADTFRAGATEQLDVWAKRDGVDIVVGPENGDPAAVVYDGVKKAKDENYDILFVDTAGRLQNKVNLMNELAKMKRILTREIPDAPHEVLLVLDATTGQNALNQAKLFKESTDVTGIVLTKLDGTARGGIVLAIRNELHLPVKYVGLGEKVDDLQEFDAGDFVYGLFKGLVTTE